MVKFGLRIVLVLGVASAQNACGALADPTLAECVTALAETALRNPANPTIASNIARETGFAPTVDATGPDILTKQLEFQTPDGSMHYFAVESPTWTRAALIHLIPVARSPATPLIYFYVMDRQGNLLQANRIQGPNRVALSNDDAGIRAGYDDERTLWQARCTRD